MTELSELYDAASKGFHISETCGPDGKYHRISKFQTLAELQAFEDAWRKAMISVRDAALSHAAGQEGVASSFVCTGDQIRCFDGNGCECELNGLLQKAPAQPPASAEVGRDSALSRGVPEGK